MSVAPLSCKSCQQECLFERVGAFPGGGVETTYGVSWICPQCNARQLDICPVGPLLCATNNCLNCGASNAAQTCPGCGMSTEEARQYLHIEESSNALPLAQQDFAKGFFRRGLAKVNAATQQNPERFDTYEFKARFFQALKFNNAAKACLQKAIELGGPIYLMLSLGVVLQELEQHEEAIQTYRSFLLASPQGSWGAIANANQGNTLVALQRFQEAEPLFERAIELEPSRSLHYYNFSRCLTAQQKWKEALSILDRGLRQCQDEQSKILLLAEKSWVHNELEQPEEALSSAELCLSISPKQAKALYHKGRAEALMGRLEESLRSMQGVLSINPEHKDAQRAIQMISNALRSS